MENEVKQIVIPEGFCCYGTCGDCLWANMNERDSNGKIWCERNRAYYYPYESSNGCSGYRTRK